MNNIYSSPGSIPLCAYQRPENYIPHWITPVLRQVMEESSVLVLTGTRQVVKQTGRPGYGDTKGLKAFLSDHPDAVGGLLLHSGSETRWLGENILAVPWTVLTG